jgi:hypothetical protein
MTRSLPYYGNIGPIIISLPRTTPCRLVYGKEVVVPVEFDVPSMFLA